MKINSYKIALLFNLFPSFSISVWFSSVFVQPRFFSLPFLLQAFANFKITKWNLLLLINIFITVFTPIVGLMFKRDFYYLDIAYVISSTYALAFINFTLKNDTNISTFNKFMHASLILNICYIFLQVIFYYSGFPELTMKHSNIPFHVNSGYTVPPGIFFNFPRYTGFFIESGPLTFFLCLSFLYLIQKGVNFPKYLKILVLMIIVLSQSKFLLLFIPLLLLESFVKRYFARIYKIFINPLFFGCLICTIVFFFLMVIFNDFKFNQYLSETIPAYQLRLNGIRASLEAIWHVEIFGKGLLPTNFYKPDASYELLGLDVFSVVFFGYGLIMGSILIISYILVPVLANFDYKFTFCAILFLGFLSSGSLLVPQYLYALTFIIVGHRQNINC